MSLVADIRSSRELLSNLTRREVKGKYKRTALGQLWSLANPLAQMVVYTLVFAVIIRIRPDAGDPSGLDVFVLWLMCGLLPWTFFTNVVNGAMTALVGNENLIKKVYFPRSLLVVSTAFAAGYTWVIEMGVLVVAILAFGGRPLVYLPVVLVTMVALLLFALGFAMLLSIANAYFRDVQHLVGILFQIWFYVTPIVYPISIVADRSQEYGPLFGDVTLVDLYRLNPMESFVEVFRNLLYDNRIPDWGAALQCVGWSAVVLTVGAWVFERHQRRLAEVL